jgi:hypothetical protein
MAVPRFIEGVVIGCEEERGGGRLKRERPPGEAAIAKQYKQR